MTPDSPPLQALALEREAYRAYGDLVAVRDDVRPKSSNMGTAERYNWLAELEDLRPGKARPNLCVFRSRPQIQSPERAFEVRILEKHPSSTQVFIPMGARRYLVLVCLGGEAPDLSTLRAFIASGAQGVTYKPGVWHHPLVAMDEVSDFACLVWEDGSSGDTKVVKLARPVLVALG